MSEAADTNTGNVEQTAPTEVQYTDIEKQAMELGWVPKDDYNGDPVKWKSAEVFVALDEPIKRIEHQSRELKQMRQALDALKQHYTKVQETEYKRALTDLKDQRKQALAEGDVDRFDKLDEAIDNYKQEAAEIKQTAQLEPVSEPTVNPELQMWINKNPWYSSYRHMRTFADELGVELAQQRVPRQEILKRVEEAVRKEFPTKFSNPNKERAGAVEAGGARSTGKSDDVELSDMERKIMNTLIATKSITKEKYLADLKKVKGLA